MSPSVTLPTRRSLSHTGTAPTVNWARRIAGGAHRVVVLHLPAELGAGPIAKDRERRGAVLRGGPEVARLRHVDPLRLERQHHRGFHVPGMDAEAVFLERELARDRGTE